MSLLDSRPFTFDRVFRIVLTVGFAYGAYVLLDYLRPVLVPFSIAFLLAYLFDPLVRFFQRRARIKSRILAIAMALLSFTAVLAGLILLVAPYIARNVNRAGELIAKLANDADFTRRAQEILPPNLLEDLQEGMENADLQTLFQTERLSELATEAVQKVLPEVWGVFSGALNLVIGVLGFSVIILYLIFILLDFDAISKGWRNLVPERYLGRIEGVVHDFSKSMSNYFRAQSLIATSVGILFAIGFSIISLPMGIVFGLFVGLLNMVPYLQNVAMIPALFLGFVHALDTGQSFWVYALMVLAVFAAVQTIQDFFLTPKIMGDAMGLNPAMILLSLSVWGQLLGILGLIIALPMTFLLLSYYRKFLKADKELHPTETQEVPLAAGDEEVEEVLG
ncbi:MAG TPA: AI-2E family transporter [Cytophagales bacterium]|nr:AI-2E family transporter [Cytophagales bacterium]HAA17430.1 AI-2E family transporter [Cytophagales bacterium]HAP64459.1 AI-2E family transporter [Cytophagales bacterium]